VEEKLNVIKRLKYSLELHRFGETDAGFSSISLVNAETNGLYLALKPMYYICDSKEAKKVVSV
jgi:hypothetical protein